MVRDALRAQGLALHGRERILAAPSTPSHREPRANLSPGEQTEFNQTPCGYHRACPEGIAPHLCDQVPAKATETLSRAHRWERSGTAASPGDAPAAFSSCSPLPAGPVYGRFRTPHLPAPRGLVPAACRLSGLRQLRLHRCGHGREPRPWRNPVPEPLVPGPGGPRRVRWRHRIRSFPEPGRTSLAHRDPERHRRDAPVPVKGWRNSPPWTQTDPFQPRASPRGAAVPNPEGAQADAAMPGTEPRRRDGDGVVVGNGFEPERG
ncbi:uncharacterized protein LOC129197710 [Grus americana]|uniref:uncharacterized protein LOC129197710 n=1 Tax=Grus americana TaxID=9117 RepID=UPI002408477A|nr:uncharacterized protein LOC129197710 [Grus americana]